jgi:hypothetical protein
MGKVLLLIGLLRLLLDSDFLDKKVRKNREKFPSLRKEREYKLGRGPSVASMAWVY